MLIAFTTATFAGAFLLFLIQPLFARLMLPQLGGSPAVWNTAMVFYQATLLLGYAYAHYSTKLLGARRQALLHCLIVLLPLFVLPIHWNENFTPPTTANPVLWMLGIMALSVGLPFFAVSATSPLLQRWLASTSHPAARDPYFLYAASNAGSLLALIAYPIIVEPNLRLAAQGRLWSVGYGVLVAALFGCTALLWLNNRNPNTPANERASTLHVQDNVSLHQKVRWVFLAFVSSSLMLSVTTYLTTDIAAIPLLWIIPLTLYLLTFIIVFSTRPPISQHVITRALPIVMLPLVVVMVSGANRPMLLLIGMHLLAFFVAALACHGALAKSRPAPENLTQFYLLMSLGGVLGGAFNALLAPLIFTNVTEYPIVIVLCLALAIPSKRDDTDGQRVLDIAAPIVVGALCTALILVLQSRGYSSDRWVLSAMFGVPCLIAFSFSTRPLRFALAVALIFLAANLRQEKDVSLVHVRRSFFGIMRVVEANTKTGRYHRLMHGSTLHGLQSLDPQRAREPLTYYGRTGPLGQLIAALEKKGGTSFNSIGAVGLGTGTAACYARPQQRWTFYEIDPAVKEIASDSRYFRYLSSSVIPPKIVLGDGRLRLKNARDGEYDLLILDAYSSDALPVHLLTREALQLYKQKLTPHGVMIFNISNRHLELAPLMAVLARDTGLYALRCDDVRITTTEGSRGKTASEWVALAAHREDFGELNKKTDWQPPLEQPGVQVWTDDYSSILSVFDWE